MKHSSLYRASTRQKSLGIDAHSHYFAFNAGVARARRDAEIAEARKAPTPALRAIHARFARGEHRAFMHAMGVVRTEIAFQREAAAKAAASPEGWWEDLDRRMRTLENDLGRVRPSAPRPLPAPLAPGEVPF